VAIDLTIPQQVAEGVLFGGIDACTIHREPYPSTTFDEPTGTYVKPPPTLVYAGKCASRDLSSSSIGGQGQQGAVPATLQRWTIKVPLDSPAVEIGDVVTITVSRDASLVGRRYVVRDAGGGTFKVSRSLAVERWAPGSTEDWLAP
jgi:hypothetical protein